MRIKFWRKKNAVSFTAQAATHLNFFYFPGAKETNVLPRELEGTTEN